jgi:hypothetical protein
MAIIIQLDTGQRITVERDIATIGQDWSCDVVIGPSADIRPIHATIMKIADGKWMIESPGDWLLRIGDGAPGRALWLKRGDVIDLSQSGPQIVFDLPTVPVKAPAEPTATVATPKAPVRTAPVAASSQPDSAAGKALLTRVTEPFRRILTDFGDMVGAMLNVLTRRSRIKHIRQSCYESLGRNIYESGVYRTGLPNMYKRLDHLFATAAARDKDAARSVRKAAGGAKLQQQIAAEMALLGKISFARIRLSRRPQDFAKPIADMMAQLQKLDK